MYSVMILEYLRLKVLSCTADGADIFLHNLFHDYNLLGEESKLSVVLVGTQT